MNVTMRWYGPALDPIPLKYIKQIPGINGIVSALMDLPAGAVWPEERIFSLKREINDAGLAFDVVESVNVHEDIKLGLESRDEYIENYIRTVENLAQAGIKVICYNFMPVFDWTRTNLEKIRSDGSSVLAYDQGLVDRIEDPQEFADEIQKSAGELEMAGWEPERLGEIKKLFSLYSGISHEKLLLNLKYFLQAIIPVCEKRSVKMALHPDDPPWDIFGLPRIVTNRDNIEKILSFAESECNGLTLCTGSLGADSDNDVPGMIREFGGRGRIHFAHLRNLTVYNSGSFDESSHLSSEGSLDMYEILKAFHEVSYEGYMRPDHGRMIWDETGRAGYGLYDRALGIAYLNGIWEAILKQSPER